MFKERLNTVLLGATRLLIAAEFVTLGVTVVTSNASENLYNQSIVAYDNGDLNRARELMVESHAIDSVAITSADLGLKLMLPTIPILIYSGTELALTNRRKHQNKK